MQPHHVARQGYIDCIALDYQCLNLWSEELHGSIEEKFTWDLLVGDVRDGCADVDDVAANVSGDPDLVHLDFFSGQDSDFSSIEIQTRPCVNH